MIVVKLVPGSDVEFETREQLEEYVTHLKFEIAAYAILLQDKSKLSEDLIEWIREQADRTDARFFCTIEARKEFKRLSMLV